MPSVVLPVPIGKTTAGRHWLVPGDAFFLVQVRNLKGMHLGMHFRDAFRDAFRV